MKSLLCLLVSLSVAYACTETEVLIGSDCVPKKNLGETCPKGVKQCPAGAICGVTCNCPAGYLANGPTQCLKCDRNTQVLVNGVCLKKATFGAACTVQKQCSYRGGICSGTTAMTCQCPEKRIWDGKACSACGAGKVIFNNKCLDIVAFGAACQTNDQCSNYTGGVCMSGKCACEAGSAWNKANACVPCTSSQVLVANECLSKAANGATCTANEQCAYPNGTCVKSVCGCNGSLIFNGKQCIACEGVILNNLCYPFAAKGQICTSNAQCTKTAGAQCIDFACDCPPGTAFNNNTCVKK